MEILTVKNLNFSYPDSNDKALKNIDLAVKEGEFILLCGASGSGKTTLLKMLKPELSPVGEQTGEIFYKSRAFKELSIRESSQKIGFVFQDPEKQLVTDKVWHELAFGLESLGFDTDYIRLRVGETAGYFGISHLFRKDTARLSGGQKQMVCLASIMSMSPEVLILDEPTSQLDPIVAGEFINTVRRLNTELGLTVIMTEHRLQEVFPYADRVAVLENGELIANDTPKNICGQLKNNRISLGFPTAARISQISRYGGDSPLTVKEGRAWLNKNFESSELAIKESKAEITALKTKNIYFKYERTSPDVLRGVSIEAFAGEHFCLLGANGSGKTTLLKVMCGILKSYKGKTEIKGKRRLAMLPQSPETLFIKESVREDLAEFADEKEINSISEKLGVSKLLDRHPYDLSGGELQRCAFCKILLTKPDIILMDEPTKGLDADAKITLGKITEELKQEEKTLITVTHDVEFAAEYADRCGLFFDGELLAVSAPQRFFSINDYYTTAASRIARDKFKYAVTAGQIIEEIKRQERDE